MAPPMVLLDREVELCDEEAGICEGPIRSSWGGLPARRSAKGQEKLSDAVAEYLQTFKAQPLVADPPELSSLNIRPPKSAPVPPTSGLESGRISSADKHLVALYAGGYRPGYSLPGSYLIYDASKDSISAIPCIPPDTCRTRAMGYQSAVVMCGATGEGGYLLAELVWVCPQDSQAALWLWESSAKQWVVKLRDLPLPPGTTAFNFSVHSCFSFGGSFLCWVDLHRGMLLCDLRKDCNFSFIELPQGPPNYDASDYPHGPCAEEFRSVACVHGSVKFLAFNKFVEREPRETFGLAVWTLSPDHSVWSRSYKCSVGDIWANANYQSAGLGQLAPSFPVLSIHQDGVVYLVVNDTSVVGKDRRLVHKAQYLLRVDMGNNNDVQVYQQKTTRIYSQLFASEFSAHRRQEHPREMESSEFGASGKRMKA